MKLKVGNCVTPLSGVYRGIVGKINHINGDSVLVMFGDEPRSYTGNNLIRVPSVGDRVLPTGLPYPIGKIIDISDDGKQYQIRYEGLPDAVWREQADFELIDDEVAEDKCVCDSFDLVWRGCSCGQFKREMEEKRCSKQEMR